MSRVMDIGNFYDSQLKEWELARDNYSALSQVLTRPVVTGDFTLLVQYNPGRIISSSAKVDAKTINSRPCFLCSHNRPVEQKTLECTDGIFLLVNPYPIFPHHFTLVSVSHMPQRIMGHVGSLLNIVQMLPGYTVIYNGPACGASAPDHFHFQAVPKDVLPLEGFWMKQFTCQFSLKGTQVFTSSGYPGSIVTLVGSDVKNMEHVFGMLYQILSEASGTSDEPMMNILASYRQHNCIIHVIPRRKHRPDQYYETGGSQLLLSPASIDMGGVLVMPREEDYNRVTGELAEDIFNQVCMDDVFITDVITKLKVTYDHQ